MLVPQVVGFLGRAPGGARRDRSRPDGYEILRAAGVVGKFVEYCGHGLATLPLRIERRSGTCRPSTARRAGSSRRRRDAPVRLTGRPGGARRPRRGVLQGERALARPGRAGDLPQVVELDLSTVEPSLAGPRRPQDKVPLSEAKRPFWRRSRPSGWTTGRRTTRPSRRPSRRATRRRRWSQAPRTRRATAACPCLRRWSPKGQRGDLHARRRDLRGSITARSSSPRSRRARTRPTRPSWSAPGCSQEGGRARAAAEAVGEVEPRARLEGGHAVLRQGGAHAVPRSKHTVGYGCTTCIGNSGRCRSRSRPRSRRATWSSARCSPGTGTSKRASTAKSRPTTSRHRRSSSRTRSPGAWTSISRPSRSGRARTGGRVPLGPLAEPAGGRGDGRGVDRAGHVPRDIRGRLHRGDVAPRRCPRACSSRGIPRRPIRRPPYFDGMPPEPGVVEDIAGARCLVSIGDSVTTDHISRRRDQARTRRPAAPSSSTASSARTSTRTAPGAGTTRSWCAARSRTCGSVTLVPARRGTWTVHLPSAEEGTIFDVAERYRAEGTPLVGLAGKEYGSGSSRDWAARGRTCSASARSSRRATSGSTARTSDDGRAPSEFMPGESRESLGLTGARGAGGRGRRKRRGERGHRAGGRQGVPRPRPARHAPRARVPAARRDPPYVCGGCSCPRVRRSQRRRSRRARAAILASWPRCARPGALSALEMHTALSSPGLLLLVLFCSSLLHRLRPPVAAVSRRRPRRCTPSAPLMSKTPLEIAVTSRVVERGYDDMVAASATRAPDGRLRRVRSDRARLARSGRAWTSRVVVGRVERRRAPRRPWPPTLLDDRARLDQDHVVELHALRLAQRQHGDPRLVEQRGLGVAAQGRRRDDREQPLLPRQLGGFREAASAAPRRTIRGCSAPARYATGGSTSGAMCSSSGSASAMISRGTRYACLSSSISARSPPGSWPSTWSQRAYGTGPVACATSPRIVKSPAARARSCAAASALGPLRLVHDHVPVPRRRRGAARAPRRSAGGPTRSSRCAHAAGSAARPRRGRRPPPPRAARATRGASARPSGFGAGQTASMNRSGARPCGATSRPRRTPGPRARRASRRSRRRSGGARPCGSARAAADSALAARALEQLPDYLRSRTPTKSPPCARPALAARRRSGARPHGTHHLGHAQLGLEALDVRRVESVTSTPSTSSTTARWSTDSSPSAGSTCET